MTPVLGRPSKHSMPQSGAAVRVPGRKRSKRWSRLPRMSRSASRYSTRRTAMRSLKRKSFEKMEPP
eukprot:7166369-Prymnesium_polylepis.1